jgi:hypothetical protein
MAGLGVLVSLLDGSPGPRARPTQLTCDSDESIALCVFRHDNAQLEGSVSRCLLLVEANNKTMVFWLFSLVFPVFTPTRCCFWALPSRHMQANSAPKPGRQSLRRHQQASPSRLFRQFPYLPAVPGTLPNQESVALSRTRTTKPQLFAAVSAAAARDCHNRQ